MTTKPTGVSFRLDHDLQHAVNKWLKQHPSISRSRLANLAIRNFISHDQILEAVETVPASKKEVKSMIDKMMKNHKKTLDELK